MTTKEQLINIRKELDKNIDILVQARDKITVIIDKLDNSNAEFVGEVITGENNNEQEEEKQDSTDLPEASGRS